MRGLPPELTADELRAFVGPNADYYMAKWESIDFGAKGRVALNPIAGLFAVPWLCYRKSYYLLCMFVSLWVIMEITARLVFEVWLGRYDIVQSITSPLAWVYCIGFACYANYFYLRHACKVALAVKGQGSDDHDIEKAISDKGGTSIPMAVIGTILSTALFAFWP